MQTNNNPTTFCPSKLFAGYYRTPSGRIFKLSKAPGVGEISFTESRAMFAKK